jgi:hypothetical protein
VVNELDDMEVDDDLQGPDDDSPAFLNRRRMIRWAAIIGFGILAVLVIWQDPVWADPSPTEGPDGPDPAVLVGAAVALTAAAAALALHRRAQPSAAA